MSRATDTTLGVTRRMTVTPLSVVVASVLAFTSRAL
jgi:hypothetical protein